MFEAHRGAVGIVFSRNGMSAAAMETSCSGARVHVVDAVTGNERQVTLLARQHQLFDQVALSVEAGVGLGDDLASSSLFASSQARSPVTLPSLTT